MRQQSKINPAEIAIFVSFESDQLLCAQHLNAWRRINADLPDYTAREQCEPDLPAAGEYKSKIETQIREAQVFVCLISQTAFLSPWLSWEIGVARLPDVCKPMVGVLLHEFDTHPPGMENVGAIFVPYKRDTVERAINWAVTEKYTSGDFTLSDL